MKNGESTIKEKGENGDVKSINSDQTKQHVGENSKIATSEIADDAHDIDEGIGSSTEKTNSTEKLSILLEASNTDKTSLTTSYDDTKHDHQRSTSTGTISSLASLESSSNTSPVHAISTKADEDISTIEAVHTSPNKMTSFSRASAKSLLYEKDLAKQNCSKQKELEAINILDEILEREEEKEVKSEKLIPVEQKPTTGGVLRRKKFQNQQQEVCNGSSV